MKDKTKQTDKSLIDRQKQGVQVDALVMLPYSAHDHNNRYKVHIQRYGDDEGALCGYYSAYYASAWPRLGGGIVNADWLDQPDPDHVICQHCRKIAKKLMAT